MRGTVLALITAVGLAGPAFTQGSAEGEAIRDVIRQQMDAFDARDMPGAFAFASPDLQQMFGSPERFGQMVEEGYPMVWDHGRVTFGDLADDDGRLWQRVYTRDAAGQEHALDYLMEQVDGAWRIAAVRPAPLPDMAV